MEGTTVSVTASASPAEEPALQAVAAAMRDAAKTASVHASEDAARLRQSAAEVGPNALEAVSRAAYTGSYLLAYGVVYATVFIAQPLP
jgi:hypothetical protein